MRYLIDGYNLLFAIGRLSRQVGKGALAASRKWLLIEIVRGHGPTASAVTVVFDAAGAPARASAQEVHGGVRVLYSVGQTADDLIEQLIQDDKRPRDLTVVSDDNRLEAAARRRGCVSLGCLDYVEGWQTKPTLPPSPRTDPGKPEEATEEEKRQWLEAFGDIDDPLYRDPF